MQWPVDAQRTRLEGGLFRTLLRLPSPEDTASRTAEFTLGRRSDSELEAIASRFDIPFDAAPRDTGSLAIDLT